MFDEGEARSLMQRHAAKFLLCSKTRGMLTQSAVDLVKDSAKNLLTEYLDIVKKSLVEKINSNPGQELQFDQDVEKLFSAESVFDGVDSEYQQRSYFKRHFNLVEPIEVEMGKQWRSDFRQGRKILKRVTVFGYQVPLLKTLEALLQNPDVLKEVENPHFSCDGVLRDVMDGDFFKSHPVFSLHSDALQLLGYYDDLEIANPLGSKAKIHKIGVFYFVLGNIRPMFRSSIRSIQLIAIAKTKDIKSFGIDNLLMPFIEDVNCLAKANGHCFTINGVARVFEVICYCGLEIHLVATMSVVSRKVLEEHCEFVGIVWEQDWRPTIRETINGVTEAKLKQSASQMWCLFRFLPIMIGDKVDEQLENWHCLLKLWNIVQICTSPGITKADAAYLKVMINDHHKMFKNLYPNASIIPKMHYLIHIPDEIVRFGPPRNIWTMRFEAKHSFLKSSITKNFKNVPKSLAFSHQRNMCWNLLSSPKQPLTNYLYSGDVVGLGDHNVDLHSHPYFGMIAQAASVDQLAQPCKGSRHVRHVEIHGIIYKPGCALRLQEMDEIGERDYPVYGGGRNRCLGR
ncbi:uncharacterized protein LOC114543958 [Dendronephthya gigantea]|uniref:uncharacterized protein LOC114543958 n=2 Tax=Dendronephthya gigantea TaxID=151771 RepID=UPI0010695E9C|nr:uncharacterized protein LOC114543958 [Dendronephthya gigantea]